MKYMRDYLIKLKEVKPILSSIKPQLNPIFNIKVIMFDVYGTLLISSSGDIDTGGFSIKSIINCFENLKIKIITKNLELLVKTTKEEYKNHIEYFHEKMKNQGYPYPEIDIIEIWKKVIDILIKKQFIEVNEVVEYKKLAFLFELFHNQVYPMPSMKKTIQYFYRNEFTLGIVSNAQFYTAITLDFFLNRDVNETEKVSFFNPELTFFSYKYLRAKPDVFLFKEAKKVCNKMKIKAEQVVYIGNDMLKDIWTAKQVGFKTVLFAGDKRSLRLRENDKRVLPIKPDSIITKLDQLKIIIKE